jgi:hypothetical protein
MHIVNNIWMTPSERSCQGWKWKDTPEFCWEGSPLDPTLLTAPVYDAAGDPVVYACT